MEVEAKAAAHNVIAQETQLLGLGHSDLQALDGEGILGADVDIALGCARGDACNEHTFNDGVGVALHDALIHESAGVALVTVADHVLHIGHVTAHALPLTACGEAAAAATTEAAVHDLLADGGGLHVEQRLFKGGVTAQGQIFIDVLGIAAARVLHNHAVLALIEGDVITVHVLTLALVEQTVDDLVAEDGFFNDLVAVLHLHMGVEDASRLDGNERADLTETVTAALLQVQTLLARLVLQLHADLETLGLNGGFEIVVDLHRAAGHTARTCADQNLHTLPLAEYFRLGAERDKLCSCQLTHLRPPPFHEVR